MSEPLLLAIESATPRVSVALLRGEAVLGELSAPPGAPAAETLLPALDRLLAQAGVGLEALAGLAVSVGPGSFTGLRIGVATAKGLAFGSGLPVAPVSTLAALARVAGAAPSPVVALLDARRGEVYAGAWLREGAEAHPCVPEGLYRPEDLVERLPRACVLVGEGLALLADALRARPASARRLVPPPAGAPSARHVGVLGARLLAAGRGVDAAELVPVYGRRAQAEVTRAEPSRGPGRNEPI